MVSPSWGMVKWVQSYRWRLEAEERAVSSRPTELPRTATDGG